jgi:rod shape-determining protein MreD
VKYLIHFIVIIVLAGVQIGFFSYLKFFGAVPDVLLLFVVGCCLQREAEDAFFTALFAGLFADFLNGLFIGSYSASFLILALLLYLIINRLIVFELSFKYLLAVVAAATLFIGLFVWLISAVALHYGWATVAADPHVLRGLLLPELVYNLVLAYPLYALATKVHDLIYAQSF